MMGARTGIVVLIALLIGFGSGCTEEQVSVRGTQCDPELAKEAEGKAASAESWAQLRDLFDRYAACDAMERTRGVCTDCRERSGI